jgi:MFS family permease
LHALRLVGMRHLVDQALPGASSMSRRREFRVVGTLGIAQTLAWASTYYLPAILADPIAKTLHVSSTWVFGAVTAAQILAALLSPRIGRRIDAIGGRGVLVTSNFVLAAGLSLLGLATSLHMLIVAWLVLGVGMSMGLYDAAFGALGRLYGQAARRPIAEVTLVVGFASAVGWPLSAWGVSTIGWQYTCIAWAIAHILIGLPLNLLLPKAGTDDAHRVRAKPYVPIDHSMVLLGIAFGLIWMVTAAMAAHLPRILEAAGASTVQAIAASALIGPSQIAGRILEVSVLSRFHPLMSARLAAFAHPIGAAALGVAGGGAASGVFAICHGTGNGIMTIAWGTVPMAIFGPEHYAYRRGLISAPARIFMAFSPLLFAALIDRIGAHVLIISSGLSLAALVTLSLLRASPLEEALKEPELTARPSG